MSVNGIDQDSANAALLLEKEIDNRVFEALRRVLHSGEQAGIASDIMTAIGPQLQYNFHFSNAVLSVMRSQMSKG